MLMLFAQNPMILQDPNLRGMLEALMAEVGLQPNIFGGGKTVQAPPAELVRGGIAGAGAPMMKQ